MHVHAFLKIIIVSVRTVYYIEVVQWGGGGGGGGGMLRRWGSSECVFQVGC